MRSFALLSFCSLALVVAASSRAHATIYNVTSTAMTEAWDGRCTLVEAINAANYMVANHECSAGTGEDTINLGSGTFTTTWMFFVFNNLTINGAGTAKTIIAANFSVNQQDLLFSVNHTFVVNDLTIRNDTGPSSNFTSGIVGYDGAVVKSEDGLRVTGFTFAGIRTSNAYVDLRHAKIDNNTNFYPQAPWNNGGGISVISNDPLAGSAGIFLYDSAVISNRSSADGGGLYFGGNSGSQVHYDTFANNQAARGGGIFIGTVQGGYFESTHLSVGANTATVSGGGIEEHHQGSGLSIDSVIVANNTAPSDANLVRTSPFGQSTDSVWGSGVSATSLGCNSGWICAHNLYGADAKFGPLMTMGGKYYAMEVLPLLKSSPAIDYGADAGAMSTDQRGMPGNEDGDNSGAGAVDAGAFEKNLIWQSEADLQWTSSNDPVSIDNNAGYSGGQGRRLQASGAGDFITYVVPIPEAGTYDVTIRIKKTSNAGKFKVGTASSQNGTYTYFTPDQDGYSGSTTFPAAFTLGSRTFSTAQKYYVRFEVTGKNAVSTGYSIYTDYLKVNKTN
jgi:hypothetical protein